MISLKVGLLLNVQSYAPFPIPYNLEVLLQPETASIKGITLLRTHYMRGKWFKSRLGNTTFFFKLNVTQKLKLDLPVVILEYDRGPTPFEVNAATDIL